MTKANAFEHTINFRNQEQLLSRRMLRKMVPVSDMTIWRWERDGLFPKHLTINSRNYWLLSEVSTWLAAHRHKQVPSATKHCG
jgi:predicted DNA-binding transcriptional regulator AlpA